jgi:hypothetical protein
MPVCHVLLSGEVEPAFDQECAFGFRILPIGVTEELIVRERPTVVVSSQACSLVAHGSNSTWFWGRSMDFGLACDSPKSRRDLHPIHPPIGIFWLQIYPFRWVCCILTGEMLEK